MHMQGRSRLLFPKPSCGVPNNFAIIGGWWFAACRREAEHRRDRFSVMPLLISFVSIGVASLWMNFSLKRVRCGLLSQARGLSRGWAYMCAFFDIVGYVSAVVRPRDNLVVTCTPDTRVKDISSLRLCVIHLLLKCSSDRRNPRFYEP